MDFSPIYRTLAGIDVLEVPGEDEWGILLLHGYGATGEDLYPLSRIRILGVKPRWFFPTAPLQVTIAPGFVGRAWFPIDFTQLQQGNRTAEHVARAFPSQFYDARRMCKTLIEELHIPLSKLVIGGFSQGAVLATELILHATSNSAGLLIFSGTVVHEESWIRQAVLHKDLSFFQSHGRYDSLLPLERAKLLEEILINAGCKGSLKIFEGDHEIPLSLIPDIKNFLKKSMS